MSISLTPQNGHTAEVLLVTRVSDARPGKQDVRSLTDQQHMLEKWLRANLTVRLKVTVNSCKGRGEEIDRKELFDLIDLVDSERFDLLLVEDLGRILRRARAIEFVENCVDRKTRMITVNDHIDSRIEDAVLV